MNRLPIPQLALSLLLTVQFSIVAAQESAPSDTQNTAPSAATKSKAKRSKKSGGMQLPQKKAAATNESAAAPESTPKPEYKRVQVNSRNAIRLNYGYPKWNKSSTDIDSASIIMREGSTGRTVQINLVETQPDSSVFSGLYSISWQNVDKLNVEFYIPEQVELDSIEGMRRVSAQIASGELKRRPFIMRRSTEGQQSIEIFDTREQARIAMKAYRAEQQVTVQNKKFPSDQEIDTARLGEEMRAKEAAAKALSERVRMEQVEASRMLELAAQAAKLSAELTAKNKADAAQLAEAGLALFQQENYAESLEKFNRAVELDPSNHAYYFKYGVALYKVENFNRSLIYLRMADDPTVSKVEVDYYIGLNYFRQKDSANAIAAFDRIAATNDPKMGPSAVFYKGMIHFEQQDWEKAQVDFQTVLDTSTEAKLDERAEAYIDQIVRIRQFEAERSRKWQISLTAGEMYDSNILLISDSARDQGSATNTVGYRSLLTSSFRYRPIYAETREFAAQLDLVSMYTLDKSFKSDQTLRNADPLVATLTFPWTHKGLAFGKGYKLDVVPGAETIFMSVENNENKAIISSVTLAVNNLFVMSNDLFSNFNAEIRQDKSNLSSSTGENDSSALKLKLTNSNMIFMNQDKSKIMTTEESLTQNQAVGSQAVFSRLDLSVGWIQPWYWDTAANLKAGAFLLSYPKHTASRQDSSFTLTAGASKKINDNWNSGLTASYNVNTSNVAANKYNKYSLMLTFSGLWAF